MNIFTSKLVVMLNMFVACFILEASEYYFEEPTSRDQINEKGGDELKIPLDLMEAIENNIPLTFCATKKLAKKVGPFFFPVNSKIECSTINRYAIGKNFILKRDWSDKSIAHSNLKAIFDSMVKLENIDFKEISGKKINNFYILLRWKLDRKKLPAPLLLTTFFSKEWNYNTGWKVIKRL